VRSLRLRRCVLVFALMSQCCALLSCGRSPQLVQALRILWVSTAGHLLDYLRMLLMRKYSFIKAVVLNFAQNFL
jgi:hypothetical protein